jgi:hypothetical protein
MYYDIVDTESEVKSNRFKNWCVDKFESVVGQFPEFEKSKTEEVVIIKEKPLFKKYKVLRYSIFPIVFILIFIDESYIRIRDLIKNIDKSE